MKKNQEMSGIITLLGDMSSDDFKDLATEMKLMSHALRKAEESVKKIEQLEKDAKALEEAREAIKEAAINREENEEFIDVLKSQDSSFEVNGTLIEVGGRYRLKSWGRGKHILVTAIGVDGFLALSFDRDFDHFLEVEELKFSHLENWIKY